MQLYMILMLILLGLVRAMHIKYLRVFLAHWYLGYTVYASLAVLATSMAQIFTNTYQKSLDCNALQLLYHTSPIIAVVSHKHDVSQLPHLT